jgi:hypothetical protein
MVRSFLKTRMVRVPKLSYIQYISNNTTQQVRNKDIHSHDRLLELGCEDFIWDEKNGCSDFNIPNPKVESHVTLTANV